MDIPSAPTPPPAPLTARRSRPALAAFADETPFHHPLRTAIRAATRIPEPQAVAAVLVDGRLPADLARSTRELARHLAQTVRRRNAAPGRAGLAQRFLQEYALSSGEGIALMCLAEALLRIPDAATRDRLIQDKLAGGNWQAHRGHSPSLFVNAATWGLAMTGRLLSARDADGLPASLARAVATGGEPMIRRSVEVGMRLMGEQFVTGQTIDAALANGDARERQGFRHSYDMLGEAALTAADAEHYRRDYERAIHAIGRAAAGRGVHEGPGISIKLSALHPRYARAQIGRVMSELHPVLHDLAVLARGYDIGLNIDAEESDRLEISLDLLERLCMSPDLAGWQGLGFVVQAYQKRCPALIDAVIDLARRSHRRLMVRLVKGAYWDAEIKRAQVDGQTGYPVYTRKAYTDLAYLHCARRLLAAPDAIFPQFATHNAQTLAAIHQLADPSRYTPDQYEFQCLHGMGESLYAEVVRPIASGGLGRPCRIYAPVGRHETLLAYLVRRLLENGANTSFVNRISDPDVAIDALIDAPADVVDRLTAQEGAVGRPNPHIPLPADLHRPSRTDALGPDLANEDELRAWHAALRESVSTSGQAVPILAAGAPDDAAACGVAAADTTDRPVLRPIRNPADRGDVVGMTRDSTDEEVDQALHDAALGAPTWAAVPPADRAAVLCAASDRMAAGMPSLVGLLIREAGKTAPHAIAEVREAIDFLRYYAAQVRERFANDSHRPLGPVVCISPWNFPLAIFTGQVAAALAAGNTVLAKPAEQTPRVAAEAVRMLHAAGVPRSALQLLPGEGATVGARLVDDPRVRGVLFTGSTDVARRLQHALCDRFDTAGDPVPLIAETGGMNAMIVDSSALTEQVVIDAIESAFGSAGQRCSALRLLCVQHDVLDRVRAMLLGAMAELRIGDPGRLAVDIGPVIDDDARDRLLAHIDAMRASGHRVHQVSRPDADADADGDEPRGSFVRPTLIEIERIDELTHEVFGPVLHLIGYHQDALDDLLTGIERTGYGLTMGLHTRIDRTIDAVRDASRVGNLYINRNMVGAVVGVQPFGGEGLSGTGPKAGGPLYLYRLLARYPLAEPDQDAGVEPRTCTDIGTLTRWMRRSGRTDALKRVSERLSGALPATGAVSLAGPTGEWNGYERLGRQAVLSVADHDDDRLLQLAAVLAVGGRMVWPPAARALHADLPASLRAAVDLVDIDPTERTGPGPDGTGPAIDLVLCHGDTARVRSLRRRLAERPGPIINLVTRACGDDTFALHALQVERVVTINTAAAGGNATLMMLG